jgi:hypothetical protein
MNVEQMEKGSGELYEFKYRSEIRKIIGNLSSIKRDDDKVIVKDGRNLNC